MGFDEASIDNEFIVLYSQPKNKKVRGLIIIIGDADPEKSSFISKYKITDSTHPKLKYFSHTIK